MTTYWDDPATTEVEHVAVTNQTRHDAEGRVLWTVDPNGIVTSTTLHWVNGNYEPRYNRIGKADATEDAFHQVTQYTYDARGNLIQTTNPPDAQGVRTVTRTAYDELGRAEYTLDAMVPDDEHDKTGTGTRTVYDGVGRVYRTERLTGLLIKLIDDTDSEHDGLSIA